MSFNFPGSAIVNISGQVTAEPVQETIVVDDADYQAGTGTKDLGQVPVNKRWRITSVHLSGHANGGTPGTGVSLTLNGVKALYLLGNASSNWGAVSLVYPAGMEPILTAGQYVRLVSAGANAVATGGFSYIEESV